MLEDIRSFKRIKAHYEIEKKLAERLKSAEKGERCKLYHDIYNELFQRVHDHPQLQKKSDIDKSNKEVERQLRYLKPLTRGAKTYLEVGAGDCRVAASVAAYVDTCYAVDVSPEVVSGSEIPGNMQLILSNGTNIPVAENSVDFVYSNQLIEHLHPDDVLEQLKAIYFSMKKSSLYLCVTPSRISGPHDISFNFDDVATGLHLQEYSYKSLRKLFENVGFSNFMALVIVKGKIIARLPVSLIIMFESLVGCLPVRLRKRLCSIRSVRNILGVNLLVVK